MEKIKFERMTPDSWENYLKSKGRKPSQAFMERKLKSTNREITYQAELYADSIHLCDVEFKDEDEKQKYLQSNQELSDLYDCSMNGFLKGCQYLKMLQTNV